MNPMALLKKPIVMLTVGLLLAIILIPALMPASIFDSWNTDGVNIKHQGVTTSVDFDTANIIGAFTSNADSETFTITAKHQAVWGAWTFKAYRYKLFVDGSDTPIQKFPTDDTWINAPISPTFVPDTWYYLQSWTTRVKTDGDVRLKVLMEYKMYDLIGITHEYTYADGDGDVISWDGALVKSGAGAIYLPASEVERQPFEAGETVNIFVKTGFTGGVGWTVMARPPADRTDLLSQYPITVANIGDNKETYITVTVGNDWFKIGSTNQWKVELWNNYFERNYEEILAIDDRERAPIITDISYINNGDSFTYTVTVEETYAALSYINVNAWYSYDGATTMPADSDTESWILNDVHYSVIGGTTTFTVYPKANIQGTVIVKVIAYDVDSRPSTPGYESFEVNWNGTTPGPDPLEQPFVWTTGALITAVILILGILAIMWFAPLPWTVKYILVIVLGIAGAILIWLLGTLQIGG